MTNTYKDGVNQRSNSKRETAAQHGKDRVSQVIRQWLDQWSRGHVNRRLYSDRRLSRIGRLSVLDLGNRLAPWSSVMLERIARRAGIVLRRISSIRVRLLVRWWSRLRNAWLFWRVPVGWRLIWRLTGIHVSAGFWLESKGSFCSLAQAFFVTDLLCIWCLFRGEANGRGAWRGGVWTQHCCCKHMGNDETEKQIENMLTCISECQIIRKIINPTAYRLSPLSGFRVCQQQIRCQRARLFHLQYMITKERLSQQQKTSFTIREIHLVRQSCGWNCTKYSEPKIKWRAISVPAVDYTKSVLAAVHLYDLYYKGFFEVWISINCKT